MINPNPTIKIRPTTQADLPFMLSLLPRFAEQAPDWRTAQEIIERAAQDIRASLAEGKDFVVIAETAQQQPVGFIRLSVKTDFLTMAPFGYVEELAVSPQAEGQGVAVALMNAAHEWAQALKLNMLGLHVFAGNERARHLYEQLGYEPEVVKYVKLLEVDGDD